MNTRTIPAKSPIFQSYVEATPTSAELYRRAQQVFPCGVTHQSRVLEPHPVFVTRAQGSRKWDVDGREYVDYFRRPRGSDTGAQPSGSPGGGAGTGFPRDALAGLPIDWSWSGRN